MSLRPVPFPLISLLLLLLSPLPITPSPILLPRISTNCYAPELYSFNTNHIIRSDCYRAIRNIYECPNPTTAINFSQNPGPAQRGLPANWASNTCVVQVSFVRPSVAHADVEVNLATIGTAALAIVRDCVEGGVQGGLAEIEEGQLAVSVFARISAQRTPPMVVGGCPSGF